MHTVGFVKKIKAYSRIYCTCDDYVPVETIVPSKIPNLFCVFNTAENSYRFLNLLFCIVKSCFYEVLCPTTKSMNLDISYGRNGHPPQANDPATFRRSGI